MAGNSRLKVVEPSDFPNGTWGRNVTIRAAAFVSHGRFSVADNVSIEAASIELGDGASIEQGVRVRGLVGEMSDFSLGDEATIAFGTQVLAPSFSMGDYSALHNSCLVSGYKPVKLGHNCWVGQQSILNCTDNLWIADNVRIGTQSQLWTHVASGELLEGCVLFGQAPLTVEDNVWLVGGAVVSPGLRLARNSVIMTGSVVTKSTEPYRVYAGVPAVDIGDKLQAWRPISIAEKLMKIRGWIKEYCELNTRDRESIDVFDCREPEQRQRGAEMAARPDTVVIADHVPGDWFKRSTGASLFCLTSKRYAKRRTAIEKRWIKFAVGFRARFIPLGTL